MVSGGAPSRLDGAHISDERAVVAVDLDLRRRVLARRARVDAARRRAPVIGALQRRKVRGQIAIAEAVDHGLDVALPCREAARDGLVARRDRPAGEHGHLAAIAIEERLHGGGAEEVGERGAQPLVLQPPRPELHAVEAPATVGVDGGARPLERLPVRAHGLDEHAAIARTVEADELRAQSPHRRGQLVEEAQLSRGRGGVGPLERAEPEADERVAEALLAL